MDPETDHCSHPSYVFSPTNSNYPAIDALVQTILTELGLSGAEVSVQFVGPNEIAELNKQFRDRPSETDVLSFPQLDWDYPLEVGKPLPRCDAPNQSAPFALGDVVICLDVAERNAREIGQSLEREVAFLLTHGILHLCGHDHHDAEDEALMLSQQRLIMERLSGGSADSKSLWHGCLHGVTQ